MDGQMEAIAISPTLFLKKRRDNKSYSLLALGRGFFVG